MLNSLKPVNFYGSSLPRPRFYVVEGKDRVDPPVPVNDALLRWAADAHWSMGGLSFKRQRMQGKIEGKMRNLRDEPEVSQDDSRAGPVPKKQTTNKSVGSPGEPKDPKRKEKSGYVKGRHGRGPSESPLVISKNAAASHPVLGEWGEEEGLSSSPQEDVAKSYELRSSKKRASSPIF